MFAIGIPDSDAASEKAEAGRLSPVNKEISTAHYCIKLLFYVIGLQASYLIWGVLQVFNSYYGCGTTCTPMLIAYGWLIF